MRGTRVRAAGAPASEAGAVTAELAIGMVAVVLVLVVLIVTTSAASARLRCLDAARTAVRAAALGEGDATVTDAAQRALGGRGAVVIDRDPPWVTVRVTSAVAGGWFTDGPITVSGSATAWVEP